MRLFAALVSLARAFLVACTTIPGHLAAPEVQEWDTASALSNDAVRWDSYSTENCEANSYKKTYDYPDVNCYPTPGQGLRIRMIAETCRVFIYKRRDCDGPTGKYMQIEADKCYSIRDYQSMKTYCH